MTHDPYDETIELQVDYSVTKIKFSPEGKKQIENLIIDNYPHTFPVYCNSIGVSPSNFYATLNGTRQCTVELLNKLLSGIGYQVSLETKLIVHPLEIGQTAEHVDFAVPENESHLNDGEKSMEVDEYDSY